MPVIKYMDMTLVAESPHRFNGANAEASPDPAHAKKRP